MIGCDRETAAAATGLRLPAQPSLEQRCCADADLRANAPKLAAATSAAALPTAGRSVAGGEERFAEPCVPAPPS